MIQPREYQIEMVSAVLENFNSGIHRQLVALPTGTGKTICFAMLAKQLGVPTLILAHRDELLTQARDKILMVDPDADVGLVRAGTLEGLEKQICISSIQSTNYAEKLMALAERDFKLLIVDEAHHIKSRLERYPTRYDTHQNISKNRIYSSPNIIAAYEKRSSLICT